MTPIRIFISSVQKEFARERATLRDYLRSDPLMRRFFQVFLFEEAPAADRRPDALYLDEVERSDLYVGLFGAGYGSEDAQRIAPTEREFDRASETGAHRLIFVKAAAEGTRHPKMKALIARAESGLIRKRFGTPDELRDALGEALVEYLADRKLLPFGPFDEASCAGATLNDLDFGRMAQFVRTARDVRGFAVAEDVPPKTLLEHLHLWRGGQPTNAAVLLFGKSPQRFVASSGVTCSHFHGRQVARPIPDQKKLEGNLFKLVDDAVDFVLGKIALHVGTRANSVQAPVTYEIPRDVIAEAIVNAVAHRDYTSRGNVQVRLFADRLEICNPGRLPPELTVAKLKEEHASYPANRRITWPLFLNRYVEESGTGTREMTLSCVNAGLPEPEFSVSDGFKVTIRRATLAGRNGVRSVVIARCGGVPVAEVELSVLFPDKTWKRAATDEDGMAHIELHSTHMPLTVFAARDGFAASVTEGWIPDDGSLEIELTRLPHGGSVIFFETVGSIPGMTGWINPIRDPLDRTYLYAHNIAVDGGKQQPVEFTLGEELRLSSDAEQNARIIRIIEIRGRTALLEYRSTDR